MCCRVSFTTGDDADAVRIFATRCAAMPVHGRLLFVEAVVPPRARERPGVIRIDLSMLILLGARERSEAEYEQLLAEARVELRRVIAIASPAGLSVPRRRRWPEAPLARRVWHLLQPHPDQGDRSVT